MGVFQVGSDVHSLTFNVWTEFRPKRLLGYQIDLTAHKVLKDRTVRQSMTLK